MVQVKEEMCILNQLVYIVLISIFPD